MTEQLTDMAGEEFVQKVLAGERDFRRIKLPKGYDFNAHERFNEMQTYINTSTSDLNENPINLIGASLSHVSAHGLSIPFLKADNTNFKKASFQHGSFKDGSFMHAYFEGASLSHTTFEESKLAFANFEDADFSYAILNYAVLQNAKLNAARLVEASLFRTYVGDADFTGAVLDRADLRQARGLSSAKGLSKAHFLDTKVSRADLSVLKKALKEQKPLVYQSWWDSLGR